MKRGHPCQLRFWNRANGWEVDCISHLSIEDKTVITCKVENGRAFTESELRDELKAAFEAGHDMNYFGRFRVGYANFTDWYDQHLKEQK